MKEIIISITLITFLFSCSQGDYYYEYYDNSQVKISGIIKDGKKEGKWLELFEDGTKKFEVHYVDGIKNGSSTVWHYTGLGNKERKLSQGNFKNDKKNGIHTFWYLNGQVKVKGMFVDNLEQGKWTSWYENGQKKAEINFVDGNKEGDMTMWHDNGEKHREGKFKNNELDGKCKVWDKEGKFIKEEEWKNGILIEEPPKKDKIK